MGLITALEQQKRDKTRYSVFLDGQYSFGVSLEIVFLKKLKVGFSLSQERVQELVQLDQVGRLVTKSLRFLGLRPRSEKELRDYLFFKGKLRDLETEEEKSQYKKSIDGAVEKLKGMKYLDDTAFASWWLEQRESSKKASSRQIRAELLNKGVSKEIIEEVLKTGSDEVEKAFAAASKKATAWKALSKEEFRNRLGQFLARRGFGWDTIKKVVDRYSQKV